MLYLTHKIILLIKRVISLKKNLSVLGSTGSIGTQTLEVAKELGIKISSLSANKNISLLEKQIREFKPETAAVFDEKFAKELKQKVKDTSTKILSGTDGLCEAACCESADCVVTAVSGMIGLEPTIQAIKAKKDIALANKETLVVGGNLVMSLASKQGVKILPVDSEHSAIFQCMQGCENKNNISKLILTASGGSFFGKSKKDLQTVTVKDALNHPNWSMGAKITVDSATMMNKGLEIIEAVHLFGMRESDIDVVIHRESIIHSMIEFVDGSVIAQMGIPSMKTPIQYALTYPERFKSSVKPLNLSKIKNLSFFEPDTDTFEAINLCRKAIRENSCAPIVLNAANEKAVELFLSGKIKFCDIIPAVKAAVNNKKKKKNPDSLSEILRIDKVARNFIKELF